MSLTPRLGAVLGDGLQVFAEVFTQLAIFSSPPASGLLARRRSRAGSRPEAKTSRPSPTAALSQFTHKSFMRRRLASVPRPRCCCLPALLPGPKHVIDRASGGHSQATWRTRVDVRQYRRRCDLNPKQQARHAYRRLMRLRVQAHCIARRWARCGNTQHGCVACFCFLRLWRVGALLPCACNHSLQQRRRCAVHHRPQTGLSQRQSFVSWQHGMPGRLCRSPPHPAHQVHHAAHAAEHTRDTRDGHPPVAGVSAGH